MKKLDLSTKIYIGLVIVLAVLAAVYQFLPQGTLLPIPKEQFTVSKSVMALINGLAVLIVYGGLGFVGLKLSRKIGFVEIWDKKVSNKQRFLVPGIIGVAIGIVFIALDLIFSSFNSLGRLPHPPFPTSILAAVTAGIGEELIFRLFFISFWVWLISFVILKKKSQKQVFWIVSGVSALAFALGHIPGLMLYLGLESFFQIPVILIVEIILLNGLVSMFVAYYFKKYGFLAAISIHFWLDIVWHVVWGLFN